MSNVACRVPHFTEQSRNRCKPGIGLHVIKHSPMNRGVSTRHQSCPRRRAHPVVHVAVRKSGTFICESIEMWGPNCGILSPRKRVRMELIGGDKNDVRLTHCRHPRPFLSGISYRPRCHERLWSKNRDHALTRRAPPVPDCLQAPPAKAEYCPTTYQS